MSDVKIFIFFSSFSFFLFFPLSQNGLGISTSDGIFLFTLFILFSQLKNNQRRSRRESLG